VTPVQAALSVLGPTFDESKAREVVVAVLRSVDLEVMAQGIGDFLRAVPGAYSTEPGPQTKWDDGANDMAETGDLAMRFDDEINLTALSKAVLSSLIQELDT
jgi:hypothetical protein